MDRDVERLMRQLLRDELALFRAFNERDFHRLTRGEPRVAKNQAPRLGSTEGEPFTLHVNDMAGDPLFDVEVRRSWLGRQVKAAIQDNHRIPSIQQVLLIGGQQLEDEQRVEETLLVDADEVSGDGDGVNVVLLRGNPTECLYWRITLQDMPADLLADIPSEYSDYQKPPSWQVILHHSVQHDDPSDAEDDLAILFGSRRKKKTRAEKLSDEQISTLSGLEGEEIAIEIEALAVTGGTLLDHVGQLLALVRLPPGVPFTGTAHIVLGYKSFPSVTQAVMMRQRVATDRVKEIRRFEPGSLALKGTVGVKYGWSTDSGDFRDRSASGDFFQPSAGPSASNLEKRRERLEAACGGLVVDGFVKSYQQRQYQADICEGEWVYVKKHSSMGCAVVGFKVPGQRDQLLEVFSCPSADVGAEAADGATSSAASPPDSAGVDAAKGSKDCGYYAGGKACKGKGSKGKGYGKGAKKGKGKLDSARPAGPEQPFPTQVRCSVMRFKGTRIDLKPHFEKQADGSRVEVPTCMFVAWKKNKFDGGLIISGSALADLFDALCFLC
eukprot:TRINITY_DN42860_c0_g2_i3.p1 TRINITY_DN42860_c0_g2~~TRINITY_DN42860_c0_g2_i3.p1  ORF type:complete len:553 (-),score=67.40 TRINITY_DN42860_c0_g2_i3:69-1727(-)